MKNQLTRKTLARRGRLLLATLALALPLGAQQTITGTVTDAETGDPLIGASILIAGAGTGAVTDLDGNYSLSAEAGTTLRYTYTGYEPQTRTVGAETVIDVQLGTNAEVLSEVVVVGYGTVKKSDNTGAVASLDATSFNQGIATSPDQLLQGRVSGVYMTQTSGQPGSRTTVRVRGPNSVQFNNDPLYVIDGVPIAFAGGNFAGEQRTATEPTNPLNSINPADIERIDVLKDASATAIYGARAANGVIIVTTKRAGKGQGRVEYDGYVGVSSLRKKLPVLSAAGVREFAAANPELEFLDGGSNTDWQDEIFRNALQQNHNLAFTGGNGTTNFRASLGYKNQDGIIISTNNEVLTGRVNVNSTFIDERLDVNLNLTSSRENADNVPAIRGTGGGAGGDVILDALTANPTIAPRGFDARFAGGYSYINFDIQNPVEQAELTEDFATNNRTLGNLTAKFDILEGLSFTTNLGFSQENIEKKTYFPLAGRFGFERNGIGQYQTRDNSNRLIETTLEYNRPLGEATNLKVLGGYSWQEFVYSGSYIARSQFVEDVSGADGIGAGGVVNNAATSKSDNRLIGFFGRANLDINNRFLITATLRRDGSTRFGRNNKWGTFPSAAVGWKISNEPFLAESRFIDALKLRVGYGVTGNQNIANYGSLALISTGVNLNPELGNIAVPATNANPNLKWESTAQANIGLDYGILEGRIRGSFEVYQKRTTDLILRFGVPSPTPVRTRLENVGEVRNTGFEFDITADLITKPGFNLEVFGNLSRNRNEVISLSEGNLITPAFGIASFTAPSPQQQSQILITRVGESLGSLYGYEFIGFDKNGREQFRDQNGDGIITEQEDRIIMGVAQPDLTYGFGINVDYGRFRLSTFFRGVHGIEILNSLRNMLENSQALPNINALDIVPRINASLPPSGQVSSRFVEDASFLRLDNVTLNYDFNTSRLGALGNASVYVTGQNLLVLTNYTGYDPEHNVADFSTYPRPRTVLLGLRLGL